MIIQAIGLLDDLDKELNTYAMRVREWYGWHFPELAKIVQDNILYAKAVKLMGDRTNAAKLDFSEVELFLVIIILCCTPAPHCGLHLHDAVLYLIVWDRLSNPYIQPIWPLLFFLVILFLHMDRT